MKASNKGQTLVEILLAVAAAGLVLIGLIRVVTISLRNAQFAKNQALATRYAQETMEIIRAYRDQNSWSVFSQESNCENPSGLSSLPSIFNRSIDCSVNGDRVTVTVTVSWNNNKHKSELISYFTKWK